MIDREVNSRARFSLFTQASLTKRLSMYPSYKLASGTTMTVTVAVAASGGVGQPLVARESIVCVHERPILRPVCCSTLPPAASFSVSLLANYTSTRGVEICGISWVPFARLAVILGHSVKLSNNRAGWRCCDRSKEKLAIREINEKTSDWTNVGNTGVGQMESTGSMSAQ